MKPKDQVNLEISFVKESGNLTDREKYGAKLRNQTVQPLKIIESIF